jgi:hypothetical protein
MTENEKDEWVLRIALAGLVLTPIILGFKWGAGGVAASILVAPIAALVLSIGSTEFIHAEPDPSSSSTGVVDQISMLLP